MFIHIHKFTQITHARTRAAQVLAPRATVHIYSYAYAHHRLAAARSVNLAAPPQRPRLEAALTCSDCHRYALHPRSPTDIAGVRIGVNAYTYYGVDCTSTEQHGARYTCTRGHRTCTRTCTSTDPSQHEFLYCSVYRSMISSIYGALLRSPRPIQVARPIYSVVVVSDRSTRRSVDLSALTDYDQRQ